jgi:hypothetical protein
MTGWDVLNNVVGGFPFVVTALFLIAALIALGIFIAGFSKYGVDFVKHGFKQKGISDLAAKIDGLDSHLAEKITGLRDEFKTELEAIKINHFGHLKNFLGELTGILLDKGVINNQDKARLDNQLRGM